MARSLDQIAKDLTALEATTTRIDEDLKALYKDYLTVLGRAVKQQLVLAVYHLCTQAYPEDFLKLSVTQREKVQAGVRKIATQGQTQIEQLGQVMDISSLATRLEDIVAAQYDEEADPSTEQTDNFEQAETFEQAGIFEQAETFEQEADTFEQTDTPENFDPVQSTEMAAEDSEADSESIASDSTLDADEASLAAASQEASEMIRRLSTSLSLFSVLGSEPLSPISLAKRHVLLERHLRAILQTLSSLTNYLLKQAHILPDLPEMVIAAAAEAEPGDTGPSTPNVLNVLVEIGSDREDDEDENDEDDEDSVFEDEESDREMTHLVAINLRLADIEFADAHTALWRSKLQEALLKLKRLGSRYQKLQREKARAEAEHAWRAVWFES